MKVLSIKQPYAELIVSGKKKIELRTWNTKFRGEFLIHASKSPDRDAMKLFGFESLLTGCIIGKAILTSVKKYKSEKEHSTDKDLHLGDTKWGDYGFVLEKPERVTPIQCLGKLNFWNFDIEV